MAVPLSPARLARRWSAILWVAVCALAALPITVLAPAAAVAQDAGNAPGNINFASWEADAGRAEATLEADRASTLALEQLRAQIVDWRTRFSAAVSANAARIATLNEQIAALGPVPEKDVAEAPEIALRRKELNDQLAVLKAPGLAAEEALRRAEGIIKQIDGAVRERQADALLKLSPSPLNPVNWPAGAAVLTQGLRTLWMETSQAWDTPSRRTELRNNLPAIILYLVMAALLAGRGPGFMERLTQRLQTGASLRARDVAAAVVSLGQIAVPVAGFVLLVLAIQSSGMTGLRSGALILAMPVAAFAFFAARWLGAMLFPAYDDVDHGFDLLVEHRAEGRFHASIIGLILAVEVFRRAFVTEVRPPLSMAAQSVWAAPLAVLMAVVLFRMGMLIRRSVREAAAQSEAIGEAARFRTRLVWTTGTALVAVSLLAPVLAIVGYVAAANALIWPTVMTLGLAGFLIVVQRLLTDIYLIVTKSGKEGREALIPVLIGLTLSLAALPVLALIWGARSSDLSEIWTRFREGVSLGETRISPTSFLTFVLIFAVGYMLTRLVQGTMKTSVLPRTSMDKGAQNAVAAGIGYFGIFIAAMVAITAAGIDLSSFAIVAGALSVGIGFGLQNIVSNFVSGIILLIERPISEGDMIQVGNQFGIVKNISVRSTRIETFDRTDVIVPNADLVSGVVTNLTRGNLSGRVIVPVGVDYGADTRQVEAILHEIAEADPHVLVDPPPGVFLVGFGADSINFEIRAILSDVNLKGRVQSEMNHEIVRRFSEAGIGIPFPQRDVWIRNPEFLRAAPAPHRPAAGGLRPHDGGARRIGTAAGAEQLPARVSTPETGPLVINNDPSDDDGDRS